MAAGTTNGAKHRARLLIVDDDERNRAVAAAILRREHDVIEAGSALAAYEQLASGGIDLVLLDIMMPGIDGFTACQEIKARHTESFLPVLLFTALNDQEHRNLGFEAGADDFLTKPVDRRELQLRVKAFLRLRAQEVVIRRQVAELERIEHLKDELGSLIVHDLRNPMTGAEGMLRLLQGSALGTLQRQYVEWALMGLAQLRGQVEDLLKVRLMQDAQLAAVRHPVSIHAVAAAAVAALRGEAELRGLAVDVEGEDLEASIDAALVTRAVQNLVANALRYTASGSRVTVTIRTDDGAVIVEVADRGKGVPDDRKHVLFERYGTLEAKAAGRGGHGLGLYMVRLVAEAHGGQVEVLDRPGGGAIFRLRLAETS